MSPSSIHIFTFCIFLHSFAGVFLSSNFSFYIFLQDSSCAIHNFTFSVYFCTHLHESSSLPILHSIFFCRTLPVLYIYTRLELCVASLAKALSSLSLVLLVWDVQVHKYHALQNQCFYNQESESLRYILLSVQPSTGTLGMSAECNQSPL